MCDIVFLRGFVMEAGAFALSCRAICAETDAGFCVHAENLKA